MAGTSDGMSNSMVGFGGLAGPGMPGGNMGGGGGGGFNLGLTAQQKMVFEVMYGCCSCHPSFLTYRIPSVLHHW